MARRKPIIAQRSPAKERKPEVKRPSNAERPAYFARRAAAKERTPEVKRPSNAERPAYFGRREASKERKPEVKRPSNTERPAYFSRREAAKERKPEVKRPSNAERSAYFARREAAKVLRSVLHGDARRRSVGSIKSLIYSPSVRNKKATYALVCQTLKHLSVIKDVLEEANVPSAKWKKQIELMYIITYDLLFGQEASLVGDAEKYLMVKKEPLQSALSRILSRKGVKTVGDLVDLDKYSESRKPRYVRVNTLKIDTETAIRELSKEYEVHEDDMVPDLLVLPPSTDLHKHPLVMNGSVFLQGKASSMAAVALEPKPGWQVIDACSAPGNKTIHLSSLMKGKGKIVACELHEERIKLLKYNVQLAGATNVKVKQGDFLKLDPQDPSYSKVRAILLDPSCSGSGTVLNRLDYLLPSSSAGPDYADVTRLQKLATFQKKVLEHALSFPGVERIVYSTCSIHQTENEDVVESVMDLASSHGFQLATPFPQWPRRGLPTFDGSEHLLRTDLEIDKEGFFIALFVRESVRQPHDFKANEEPREKHVKRRKCLNVFIAKLLKVNPHRHFKLARRKAKAPPVSKPC